jgi:multimeric flavodoxin WrbA
MRCLAVACSPRKEANTSILAGEALAGAKKAGAVTEILYLTGYSYAPCMACDGCFKNGRCIVKDDAAFIFNKILEADRIILAAPIFSMSICAQAKMLIDRSQQFWAARYILKQPVVADKEIRPARRGIFISAAGTNLPGVFEGAIRIIQYFYKIMEICLAGCFCYPKIDRKGEIKNHPAALAEVFTAGMELAGS